MKTQMIFRKTFSLILALILCFALVSVTAFADEPEEPPAEEPTSVSTEADLRAIVAALNESGGEKTIELAADVAYSGTAGLSLSKGELTILGGSHKLTAYVLLSGDAVLNLGAEDYEETLEIVSNNASNGILDITGQSVLNIYDGVSVGPSIAPGMAGGVNAHSQSTFNMYGGTIHDCNNSVTVSGGVYLDGNSVFNMYDGIIENCSGLQGGAVGLSGATPIGGSGVSSVTFNMYGGTIRNCVDSYIGGGAVCAWTSYPVVFNMYGGTIENCSSTSYGYGGAISLYTTSDTTFHMDGGSIRNNICGGNGYAGAVFVYARGENTDIQLKSGAITGNSAKYGGGIFVFAGNVTIADGFTLCNNSAELAGDDIYSNGANVTLGTPDTTATLDLCGHAIDGWYDDAEGRWSYSNCTGEADHLVRFTHTGELYAEEYGLKAAHGPYAPMTVKKTFSGISASQIPEAFEMAVTLPGAAEPAATLKTTDEGVAVSEDGLTFTWTLEVPAGNYTVSENRANAEINNYSLTVSGDDGVEKEVGGEEAAVFEIINSYSYITPYYPPEPTPTPVPTPTPEPSRIPPDLEGGDHFAYIMGCPDGLVHPEDNITRAEVATIFFRLLKDEIREANLSETNDFSDVSEGMWFNRAVSTLANMGIVFGNSDGTFKPSDNITRAEFAAITARFDRTARTPNADFSDIEDHWAYLEISKAAENGWVNGYPDGTFRPDTFISRAEAMALINRVLERTPSSPDDLLDGMITWADNMDTTAWYYLDVQEATNSHDYERPAGSSEKWTKLTELRDWTILEQ